MLHILGRLNFEFIFDIHVYLMITLAIYRRDGRCTWLFHPGSAIPCPVSRVSDKIPDNLELGITIRARAASQQARHAKQKARQECNVKIVPSRTESIGVVRTNRIVQ